MTTRTDLSSTEVLAALHQTQGDVQAAAPLLGVSSRTLYRRMAELGIASRRKYELRPQEAA